MMDRLRDKPLEFEPGERFAYSNSGYFLLGYIVEKASGLSYEQFVRQFVFEPLGMKDSGCDHFETILSHRAAGYARRRGHLGQLGLHGQNLSAGRRNFVFNRRGFLPLVSVLAGPKTHSGGVMESDDHAGEG